MGFRGHSRTCLNHIPQGGINKNVGDSGVNAPFRGKLGKGEKAEWMEGTRRLGKALLPKGKKTQPQRAFLHNWGILNMNYMPENITLLIFSV